MASFRLRAALLLVVGLLAACGGVGGTGSTPKTVTVGPDDAGRAITLEPGDRLVLALAEPAAPQAIDWNLLSYPDPALELILGESDAARFEFVAREVGGGRIELSGRPNCQPLAGSEGGPQCPLLGAGGAAPVRLFVVTVRVEAA